MWLWRWLAPLGGVPTCQIDLLRRQPQVWIGRALEVLHAAALDAFGVLIYEDEKESRFPKWI